VSLTGSTNRKKKKKNQRKEKPGTGTCLGAMERGANVEEMLAEVFSLMGKKRKVEISKTASQKLRKRGE